MPVNKKQPLTTKPVVFVSILPQQYFVQRIAGDRYHIEVMIPPGMGHSDYDPTPQQMKELANAKLFFRIGYIVFEDAWMKTIAANNPRIEYHQHQYRYRYHAGRGICI